MRIRRLFANTRKASKNEYLTVQSNPINHDIICRVRYVFFVSENLLL